ncbi:hypothetical protein DFP72DRAFT_972011 [Ephemerocybe angulata]|uniref:BTB domain-containing protein n=1 Tax=Ephemerocybe angulata TaxID=980116 RepID=A0A8H6HIY8_9AGAR|nr:hypothetical protein DFP72DRAFT_972011 [Tulosesus angulatus]
MMPKRRRTDTAANDNEEGMDETNSSEEIKRSPEFWFHDGSVVLQADQTQFQVHKAILERHSTVFKDVFAMPHPEGEPTVDGRAILHVQDSAEEIQYMLSALYDHSYNSREPISFDIVKALIKLGTKYDIGLLRKEGVSRLRMEFPSTFFEYEESHIPSFMDPKEWEAIKYRPGLPFEIANFAYEHDVTEVLPTCYFFCTTKHKDELLDGILVDEKTGRRAELSPNVQRICLAGHEKLLERYNSAFGWVDKFDEDNLDEDCKNPEECLTLAKPLISALWRPRQVLRYLLYPWPKLRQSLDWYHSVDFDNCCATCLTEVHGSVYRSTMKTWNELPSYFGLASWKDLRKSTLLAES